MDWREGRGEGWIEKMKLWMLELELFAISHFMLD
jgi:hypothetical protein